MIDITELAQSLKAAAEKASNGDWVKGSGEGWEACRSANDQANGGFIIAYFVGPDAAENREFVQVANPANVLALVEALEYYKSREERVTSLVRDNSKSWDELYRQVEAKGKRNVELVWALEKARAGEKQWRELVDAFCSDDADWHKLTNSNNELIALLSQVLCKQADRIAELENQLKSAENNEIDARCHIAELESSTVKLPKLKMLEDYLAEVAIEERKQILVGVKLEFHRALAAAGIKVEVE